MIRRIVFIYTCVLTLFFIAKPNLFFGLSILFFFPTIFGYFYECYKQTKLINSIARSEAKFLIKNRLLDNNIMSEAALVEIISSVIMTYDQKQRLAYLNHLNRLDLLKKIESEIPHLAIGNYDEKLEELIKRYFFNSPLEHTEHLTQSHGEALRRNDSWIYWTPSEGDTLD